VVLANRVINPGQRNLKGACKNGPKFFGSAFGPKTAILKNLLVA
jgi:hypothetical protein